MHGRWAGSACIRFVAILCRQCGTAGPRSLTTSKGTGARPLLAIPGCLRGLRTERELPQDRVTQLTAVLIRWRRAWDRHVGGLCVRPKGAPARMRAWADRGKRWCSVWAPASAGRACCSWSTAPPGLPRSPGRSTLSQSPGARCVAGHGRMRCNLTRDHAGHRLRNTARRSVRDAPNSMPRCAGAAAPLKVPVDIFVIWTESCFILDGCAYRGVTCGGADCPLRWRTKGLSRAKRH